MIDLLGNGHVHHDGHRVVRECPDGRTCVVLDVLQQRERHALHAGDRVRVVDVIYMQLCGLNGSEQVAHTACLSLGLCVSLNGLRERVQLLLRLRLHCHQDGGRRRSRVCVEVSRATAACTQTRPCVSEKARIGAACHGCRYIFGNLMRTSQVELLIQVRSVYETTHQKDHAPRSPNNRALLRLHLRRIKVLA